MNKTCPSCGFDFEEDEPRIYVEFYHADVCEDCIRRDWIFDLIANDCQNNKPSVPYLSIDIPQMFVRNLP